MLNFNKISDQDRTRLQSYYCNCQYKLCEYTVGTKLMWENVLNPTWSETAGCLVIRNQIDGRIVFDYPVPGPDGDEDAALTAIENECIERGIPLVISVVPEEKAPVLLQRYPYARVSNIRTWRDYVYHAKDLQEFVGRRYAGQRNHIKKFRTAHPTAAFRPLTKEDSGVINRFWEDYDREFSKTDDPKAVHELTYAKRVLGLTGESWLRCGGIFEGEKLIALSAAEKCGDTLVIHIEKALYSYEGVYPTLVQDFARAFGNDVQYLNREDDAANRGLRTSKLQYGPAFLASKYCFEPQNELLSHVREIPALRTERLTLSALTEADLPAYNALVLDQERNRWWGYDDEGSLPGPRKEDSFLEVARRDFANRLAINFAVRLDGMLIGEAVLYRFNYRGDAELGCRIAGAYAGHGYGTEAFDVVANWALYQVHLTRVVAKCYRENEESRRMLASCMRPAGQDETFYYFEKIV